MDAIEESEDEKEKKENKQNKLMLGTVKGYVSGIMNEGKKTFVDKAAFFSVLGGKKSQVQFNNWYMELNSQIEKVMARR